MWEKIVKVAITDNICAHLNKMIQVDLLELMGDTPENLKPFWPI